MTDPNIIHSQNEALELVFAYSLGCLDKADLTELNHYFQSEIDFPWQELGEYQNLAALLPAILNMESPGPELKDKVARKLYRIKNERRPKAAPGIITKEQQTFEQDENIPVREKAPISDIFEHAKPSEEESIVTPKTDENISLKPEASAEPDLNLNKEDEENRIDTISDNDDNGTPSKINTMEIELKRVSARRVPISSTSERKNYKLHGVAETKEKKNGKGGTVFLFIILIIVLGGGTYLYQQFSSNVEQYKTGVERLNKQVSSLTKQMEVNKEVQKILQMKDAHIINLFGSSTNSASFGKIILSFESDSGFLQLSDLPVLNNESAYQLWMTSDGRTISLGVFKPIDNLYYFPISLPSQNYKGEIRFFVTVESFKGAVKPSSKVYLTGTIQ